MLTRENIKQSIEASERSIHLKLSMQTVVRVIEDIPVVKTKGNLEDYFFDEGGFEILKDLLQQKIILKKKSTQAKMLAALGCIRIILKDSLSQSPNVMGKVVGEEAFRNLLLKHFTMKGWTLGQEFICSNDFRDRLLLSIKGCPDSINLKTSANSYLSFQAGINLINQIIAITKKEKQLYPFAYKFCLSLYRNTNVLDVFMGGLDNLFKTSDFSEFKIIVKKMRRANYCGGSGLKDANKKEISLYSSTKRKKPSSFKLSELPASDLQLLNNYLEFRTAPINTDGSLRKKMWHFDRRKKCHTYDMMLAKMKQFFGFLKDQNLIPRQKVIGLWVLTDFRYFNSFYEAEVGRGVSPSTLEKHLSWILSLLNPKEFLSNKEGILKSWFSLAGLEEIPLSDLYVKYSSIFAIVEKRVRTESKANDTRIKLEPFLRSDKGPLEYLKLHVLANLDKIFYSKDSSTYQKEMVKLMIHMMVEKPLRLNSLVSIKVSDLSMAINGCYSVKLPRESDKSKNPVSFTFSQKVTGLIKQYIGKYRPKPKNASYTDLFLNSTGRPFTDVSGVSLIFTLICREASLRTLCEPLRITPHMMRHICATQFLIDNPKDYYTCAQLLDDTIEEVIENYSFLEGTKFQENYNEFITAQISKFESSFDEKRYSGSGTLEVMLIKALQLESEAIRKMTISDLKNFFNFLELNKTVEVEFNEKFIKQLHVWSSKYPSNTAKSKKSRILRIVRILCQNSLHKSVTFPIYTETHESREKVCDRSNYSKDWRDSSIATYVEKFVEYKENWSQSARENFLIRASLVCGFMEKEYGRIDFKQMTKKEFFDDYHNFLTKRGNKCGDSFGKFVCEWVNFLDFVHVKLLQVPFENRNPLYSYGKYFRRNDSGEQRKNMLAIEGLLNTFEVPAEPLLRLVAFLKSKSRQFLGVKDLGQQWEVLKASGLAKQKAQQIGVDELYVFLGLMIFKPIRLKNLCEDLAWSKELKIINSRVQLLIPREKVKNNRDIRFTFPDWLSDAALELARRKGLKAGDNLFSFTERRISLFNTLRSLCKSFIGVEINPHAFRHIMVTNYLTIFREDYVGASMICNHDFKTMLEYYSKVNISKQLTKRAEMIWD